METYLSKTQINDFIFCPRSIYFHNIFRNTSSNDVYHQTPQRIGQAHHTTIDTNTYSTRKDIITGLFVYSAQYNLVGRIDILDLKTKTLTERKYSVTAIYDGFRFQLFAQYFALLEMGFEVEKLRLHSKKDNKAYHIDLPTPAYLVKFQKTLNDMHNFSLFTHMTQNPNKCKKCIYNTLCDIYEEEENAFIS